MTLRDQALRIAMTLTLNYVRFFGRLVCGIYSSHRNPYKSCPFGHVPCTTILLEFSLEQISLV